MHYIMGGLQGNAGVFEDVKFVTPKPAWSAVRHGRIGYGRIQARGQCVTACHHLSLS